MCRISVSFNSRQNNRPVLIRVFLRSTDSNSTVTQSIFVNSLDILNFKGNILNSISMINQMFIHYLTRVFVVNRAKDKNSPFVIFNSMMSHSSFSSFKTLVGIILKSKSTCVVSRSLLGIPNPESQMVYIIEKVPKRSIFPNGGRCPFSYISDLDNNMIKLQLISIESSSYKLLIRKIKQTAMR